ncbi:helix-hairpin-helix domain-containing protein [soil metagenome]
MIFLTHLKQFVTIHIFEIALLSIALVITVFSSFSYFQEEAKAEEPQVLSAQAEIEEKPTPTVSRITVDVSGAIVKPDIYQVTYGARLADVIHRAGGLDAAADSGFIARNFNMARFVVDQEKVYVPFKKDISNGLYTEAPHVLDYLNTDAKKEEITAQTPPTLIETSLLISINTATTDELDMLKGVGPTTAQKIIDNRPYATIDELISKKVLKQSVFDDNKDLISL